MPGPRTVTGSRSNPTFLRVGAIVAVGAIAFLGGYLAHRQHIPWRLMNWGRSLTAQEAPERDMGVWFPDERGGDGAVDVSDETLAQLRSIGYLSGYEKGPSGSGVRLRSADLAFDGYNFYTSGHAPEAILMDMEGRRLHTWTQEFRDVWPDRDLGDYGTAEWWRRAYLYPNGDVLAIYDRLGLIKIDKSSNLVWSYAGNTHHDIEVMEDGRVYVLEIEELSRPELNPDGTVSDDFITVLDAEGKVLSRVSILAAFENSSYASLLDRLPENTSDILHTNTLEVLDGRLESRSPAFKAGNVLISLRNLDVIAVVDMDRQTVVWALAGMWSKQHDPGVLESGNLMLFDNLGHHGFSKVVEFDPFTQAITWAYEGGPDNDFRSPVLGANQRLPNGNTLITESTRGRAFEVTADGTMVWEFVNPERSGDEGELIALLCEVVRLDPDFPLDWRDW